MESNVSSLGPLSFYVSLINIHTYVPNIHFINIPNRNLLFSLNFAGEANEYQRLQIKTDE